MPPVVGLAFLNPFSPTVSQSIRFHIFTLAVVMLSLILHFIIPSSPHNLSPVHQPLDTTSVKGTTEVLSSLQEMFLSLLFKKGTTMKTVIQGRTLRDFNGWEFEISKCSYYFPT